MLSTKTENNDTMPYRQQRILAPVTGMQGNDAPVDENTGAFYVSPGNGASVSTGAPFLFTDHTTEEEAK
jgi:hypothetical protein